MRRSVYGIVSLLAVARGGDKTGDGKGSSKEGPEASTGEAKPEGVMRCPHEKETGSNFAERVCTYEDKNGGDDTTIDDAMIRAQQRASQHVAPGMGGGN